MVFRAVIAVAQNAPLVRAQVKVVKEMIEKVAICRSNHEFWIQNDMSFAFKMMNLRRTLSVPTASSLYYSGWARCHSAGCCRCVLYTNILKMMNFILKVDG